MARKQDSVELVINAKNETEKTFDQVKESVAEITAALTKRGGFSGFFDGIERQIEGVIAAKGKLDGTLKDVSAYQKTLDKQKALAASLGEQSAAALKAERSLADLQNEYEALEKAANQARVPNEKLTQSLTELTTKQSTLGEKIAATRQEIDRSTAALRENAGVDAKAAGNIAKQESKLLQAGKAWRQLTIDVNAGNRALNAVGTQRDNTQSSVSAGKARLAAIKDELQATKELAAQFQKVAKTSGSGQAVNDLLSSAKARVAELKAIHNLERQGQADLQRQLSSLTAEFRKQETTLTKTKVRATEQKKVYDDLKLSIVGLVAAQKTEGSARQQSQIDSLIASLKGLESQYDSTTKRIASTNNAISKASAPDPKAIAQRDGLLAKINQTIQVIEKEKQELTALKTRMEAAGLSTAALTARQKELDAVTSRLTAEQRRLTVQMEAVEKVTGRTGAGIKRVGNEFNILGNGGRTTLGFLQRIRGEFLAIAATYGGVFAVGSALRAIYDTSVLFSKAESRFGVFFKGDTEAVKKEVEFVKQLSNDLKINFEAALEEYSKFVSGIDPSKIPLNQVREIFQDFSVAARVGRISTEDFSGVMRALTQIFSKQKVQLEELQGQIGDRLPNALGTTANALKIPVDRLRQMIENGSLGAEAMILFAQELKKTYGSGLNAALQAPDAALADFQNSITELKTEVGSGDFIKILTDALRDLTVVIRSPEFKSGVKSIADGFVQLIAGTADFVKNIKDVIFWIKLFGASFVGLKLVGFAKDIIAAGTALRAFGVASVAAGTGLGALNIAMGTFIAAIPAVLAAGAAGFAIGTWANQFDFVQKAGVRLVGRIQQIILALKMLAEAAANPIDSFNNFDALAAKFEQESKAIAEITKQQFADIDAGIYRDRADSSKSVIVAEKQITDELNKQKSVLTEQVSEQEAAAIRAKLLSDANLKQSEASSKAAATKLAALRESIANTLVDIDRQIQEQSADTLSQRLEAIRLEYDKLLKKIEKAGGNVAFPKAKDSIDQIVAIKQVQEAEKEINRLTSERKDNISQINELQSLGSITIEEANKRVAAENVRILPQMTEALAKAKEIAATVNSKPITQNVDNLDKSVELEKQRIANQAILDLERAINVEMDLRAQRIQTVNALVQTNAISEADGKLRILEINRQAQEQTRQQIADLETMILANKELADSAFGQSMLEKARQYKIELGGVKEEIVNASQLNESFASGLTGALEGFIRGTMSAKDAFRGFISDFLIQIARAIVQALILKAITAAFGGAGGGLGGAIAGAVNHTGGIVGQTSARRRVPITAFAGAVKYHSGGIAGLKSNEVPSILEKGEEVITRNDPRHILNGSNGGNSSPTNIKIVNAIDSASVMNEALNSSAGQKSFVNTIRANKSAIKSILG